MARPNSIFVPTTQEREAMYKPLLESLLTKPAREPTRPLQRVMPVPADVYTPQSFEDYIGQSHAKKLAHITVTAAKNENRPIPSLMIVGGYGLGKTTLARIIVKELGHKVNLIDGASVSAAKIPITTNPVIIDEIHNVSAEACDSLNLLLDTNQIVVIGCTTNPGMLPSAFRSRFRMIYLDNYTILDIVDIIEKVLQRKDVNYRNSDLREIAKRSRFNARAATRHLSVIFDVMALNQTKTISNDILKVSWELLTCDENGYLDRDYKYMAALPYNKPVGLQYLEAVTGIDRKTLEDEVEPYLLQTGKIDRSPRGRVKLAELN